MTWSPILQGWQVARIKRQFLDGELCRELAEEYGVSLSCIKMITSGRTWKHVNPAKPFKERANDSVALRRLERPDELLHVSGLRGQKGRTPDQQLLPRSCPQSW